MADVAEERVCARLGAGERACFQLARGRTALTAQVRPELRAPRCAALCQTASLGNHELLQYNFTASGGVFVMSSFLLL